MDQFSQGRPRSLSAAAQVEDWVTAALGKVLGTGAGPTAALAGVATELQPGTTAADLTDHAIGTVAEAVASKVQGATADADSIAERVIAKLPVGLQVVASSGLKVAEASVQELTAELATRFAQAPEQQAATPPVPVSAAA